MFSEVSLKCYSDQKGVKFSYCDRGHKTCYTKFNNGKRLQSAIYKYPREETVASKSVEQKIIPESIQFPDGLEWKNRNSIDQHCILY